MNRRLVYGEDAIIAKWIERQLGIRLRDDARAIGIERDGALIAGVGYDTFTTTSCSMHIAALPGVWWAGRQFLQVLIPLAAYPFNQCQFRRVSAFIESDNYRSRRLVERLGAQQEGVMRCAGAGGGDLIVYGMLREECSWLVNSAPPAYKSSL